VDPVVYLPTSDPDAFALIFEWLYRQKLTAFSDMGSGRAIEPARQGTAQFNHHLKVISTLIKVYSLALLWEMPELSDLVMNQLGKAYFWTWRWPSEEEFRAAYYHTRSDCRLRKFMARTFNYMLSVHHDNCPSHIEALRTEELFQIYQHNFQLKKDSFELLREVLSGGSTRILNPGLHMVCDYHEHGKQKVCEFIGMTFKGMQNDDPRLNYG
jgi:hypothetical protein